MSHVLHCGDGIAGMAAMPDRSVDHTICDPPYEAEAHTLQRRTKQMFSQARGAEKAAAIVKPITFAAITADQRAAAAAQMARVTRRWILVFCQAEAVSRWAEALTAGGATYRRAAIWVKPDGQPQLTGDRPGMGYESIVCAHAPGKSRWNGGGKLGVFTFAKQGCDDGHHETVKPLALMEALIRDFTDAGDLVCDPYSGAATTGVACKRLGRRFVGWEINEKFHAAAVRRIDAAREQFQLPRLQRPRQLQLEGPEKDPGEAA